MMKRSKARDLDALDVLVLSHHLVVWTIVEILPIAALKLIDNVEVDTKIIAVPFKSTHQVIYVAGLVPLQPLAFVY